MKTIVCFRCNDAMCFIYLSLCGESRCIEMVDPFSVSNIHVCTCHFQTEEMWLYQASTARPSAWQGSKSHLWPLCCWWGHSEKPFNKKPCKGCSWFQTYCIILRLIPNIFQPLTGDVCWSMVVVERGCSPKADVKWRVKWLQQRREPTWWKNMVCQCMVI